MKLFSIANPGDLRQATSIRFRQRLAEAVNAYRELSESYVDPAFLDCVERASLNAIDNPASRAWTHTVRSLGRHRLNEQSVPHSSTVGHIDADGPTVERLFELLSWEAVGAIADIGTGCSFEMPGAPPRIFAIGVCGAFALGDHWPSAGKWKLSLSNGVACVEGPASFAISSDSEPSWIRNIQILKGQESPCIPLSNAALVNRDFQEFPIVRSRAFASQWSQFVRQAIELIGSYNVSARAFVETFVRCVVPLMGADDAIGSASREEALGLIFLPASDRIDQVAECLLHEAMHQYLFRIEECGDLFTPDTETAERFYSPWRSDLRPLRMVLHGAFVFMAVSHFYLWEGAHAAFGIDRIECEKRSYYRASQVRTAVDIIRRNARLTRFGNVVLDAIEYDLASILDKVHPTGDDRAVIDSLLGEHSDRYASYAR